MYQIDSQTRMAGDRNGPVITLRSPTGARAEIWTACGFNCLKWSVADGKEALFSMPDWAQNPVPTRSGIPILAPFPNRIRDGRFSRFGQQYSLPLNCPVKKNAIHGEAPRHPWRILDSGSDRSTAWVTAEFQPSKDAPEANLRWTGDYILQATWRLIENRLSFEYSFQNPGDEGMPFGIGLHPYLRFPLSSPDEPIDESILEVPAHKLWELKESLPTGRIEDLTRETDFLKARPIAQTNIDHLFTSLSGDPRGDGLRLYGRLTHPKHPGSLEVWADPKFREIVLFTPVHRRAVCIEPYTCATDAVNLQAQGIDSGLIVVEGKSSVLGKVEFCWQL